MPGLERFGRAAARSVVPTPVYGKGRVFLQQWSWKVTAGHGVTGSRGGGGAAWGDGTRGCMRFAGLVNVISWTYVQHVSLRISREDADGNAC